MYPAPIRKARTARGITLLTLIAFAASCASANLPPITSVDPPFQPENDEVRLWEKARSEEAKLREKVSLYQDPLLEDYLEGIVQRLNPPEMERVEGIGFRVSVVQDPTLNAFAYPTGSLYVHTGLLARMENEDQLATVLGHEMTHVENRHMVRYTRSAQNKQIGFSLAAIAGAVIVAGEEGEAVEEGDYGRAARIGVLTDVLIGLGLTLAILASVNGYGRNLEREADAGGFDKMSSAGYDVREAPGVYQALLEDHGDSGKAEAFFFGSHPRLEERIQSAQEWAAAHPDQVHDSLVGNSIKFAHRIRPVIRDDARMNIEMGRLELAEFELKRAIDLLPADATAHELMGKLRLVQAEKTKDNAERERLGESARASFGEAVRLDPARPGPHRELGLLAYRRGDFGDACTEFARYLELAPDAEDAQSIRDYRLELDRDGHCPAP